MMETSTLHEICSKYSSGHFKTKMKSLRCSGAKIRKSAKLINYGQLRGFPHDLSLELFSGDSGAWWGPPTTGIALPPKISRSCHFSYKNDEDYSPAQCGKLFTKSQIRRVARYVSFASRLCALNGTPRLALKELETFQGLAPEAGISSARFEDGLTWSGLRKLQLSRKNETQF